MIHLGDITKLSGYDVPIVDCVIGGSPCQGLSLAGKREGLDDERSVLFLEQTRLVKEMRDKDAKDGRTDEFIRPRFMVWENVPGAFSSNKGEDFRVVLEETAKVIDKDAVIPLPDKGKWSNSGCIMGNGWSIAWRVFDAQFWGVPQRRRRIALVADFGGGCSPEILFVRKGLQGNSAESRKPRQGASEDAQGGFASDDREGRKNYGFPLGFRPENVRLYEEKATTLCLGTRAGFCNGVVSIENHPADSRVNIDDSGKVQTFTSRMGTGGGNVPMVMEAVGLDCYNQAVTGDKAITLRAIRADNEHIPCVVMDRSAYNQGINANVELGIDENGKAFSCLAKGPGAVAYVYNQAEPYYIVRRLTPLECERLQGYPDLWTDIGEFIGTDGKKKQSSDASRYKALGNSIALPPWKWVIKRLCSHYERDATMASLFDGIGGFPYIWEMLNGKGSCLWASEIEEFPMAVTRTRIG